MDGSQDLEETTLGWERVRTRLRPEWRGLERYLAAKLAKEVRDRPKYKQLQETLADAIRDGFVEPDSRLPTESELTAITPFSLGTVQRALKNLVREGLIARRPGVGTIVVPLRWRMQQPLHTRFHGPDGAALPVFTRVLSRRKVTRDGPWSTFLGPAEEMLVIRRRLDVGRVFALYNEFCLDGARYPVFRDTPKRELDGVNFKILLAKAFNLAITRITHRLSVAPAPESAAKVLGLELGTPCLHVRALAHLSERPLYYQEYWIPPGVPELVIDSSFEQLAEA